MRKRSTQLALALACGGLLSAVGCGRSTQQPTVERALRPEVVQQETFSVRPPQVVLGGDWAASNGTAERQAEAARLNWWSVRNDAYLNLRPESQVVSATGYVILVDDRQQSFGDDIYNIYRRRVISETHGSVIRD